MSRSIVTQFRRPSGTLGAVVGFIMLNRPSNRLRNKWAVGQLGLKADARVIEIGCGPGYALGLAARIVRSGKLTGLDHSEAMIRVAARRLARHIKKGRVELFAADYTALHDYAGAVDAIYSVNVIQFIDSHDAYFEFAYRALATDGIALSVYQPRMKNAVRADADRMSAAIRESMIKAGFKNIKAAWLELKPVPAVSVIGHK